MPGSCGLQHVGAKVDNPFAEMSDGTVNMNEFLADYNGPRGGSPRPAAREDKGKGERQGQG